MNIKDKEEAYAKLAKNTVRKYLYSIELSVLQPSAVVPGLKSPHNSVTNKTFSFCISPFDF